MTASPITHRVALCRMRTMFERVPAHELEDVVIQKLGEFLRNDAELFTLLEQREVSEARQVKSILARAHDLATQLEPRGKSGLLSGSDGINKQSLLAVVQSLVHRVMVSSDNVQIDLRMNIVMDQSIDISDLDAPIIQKEQEDLHAIAVPVQLKRNGMAMRLIIHGQMRKRGVDSNLIQLVAKGHQWFEQLSSGKANSLMAIAEKESVQSNYVTRVINLAFLAPDIIKAIIEGKQPPELTADTLMDHFPLPIDWSEQRALLGFSH
jgi:site-specific DNA recombinase